MAFRKATGYTNLPNGVFSPVIYSKKVQKAFRKSSVAEDITNTDYFGEIANMGDSVKIIKEPTMSVKSYSRGTAIVAEDIVDTDFTMVIDQANYFAFTTDDIEEKHQHVNFEDLASDEAGYRLRDAFDRDVIGYAGGYVYSGGVWSANTTVNGTKADTSAGSDELLAANKITRGTFVPAAVAPTDSLVVGTRGTYDATPLAVMNRINRYFDARNVPTEGRWIVIDPVFHELLLDEDSKLVNGDYGASDGLRNGRVIDGKIRNFRVYLSNNLPQVGTGSGTNDADGSAANFGILVAGHDSAVATAQQINKTEVIRRESTFGDLVRGMQLYGRKILRPEAIATVKWNVN